MCYNRGGPEMGNKEKCGVELFKEIWESDLPQLKRELSLFRVKGLLMAWVNEDTWIHICGVLYTKGKEKVLNASGDSGGKCSYILGRIRTA